MVCSAPHTHTHTCMDTDVFASVHCCAAFSFNVNQWKKFTLAFNAHKMHGRKKNKKNKKLLQIYNKSWRTGRNGVTNPGGGQLGLFVLMQL